MARLLKILALLAVAVFVARAVIVTRSTVSWFFAVNSARITVDGKQGSGWVHKGHNGRAVILTRTEGKAQHSYWIEHGVGSCEGWTAAHFPILPLRESNGYDWTPVCFDDNPNPPERNFVSGTNFVEFTADNGQRVRASW